MGDYIVGLLHTMYSQKLNSLWIAGLTSLIYINFRGLKLRILGLFPQLRANQEKDVTKRGFRRQFLGLSGSP